MVDPTESLSGISEVGTILGRAWDDFRENETREQFRKEIDE